MAKHGVGERLVSQGGILLYHSRKSWSRFYLRILAVALAFCSVCFALGTKVNAAVPQQPSIYGEAAVLLDASTGQILYGKNIHQQMEPASLTKIMTCLIAIEEGDPDAVLSVSEQAVEDMEDSSTMDVVAGESLSLRELLYGLMLPSANDAANVIAEYFSGGNEGFAQKMNQRAQELELWDTHFVNPNGLNNTEHYTTPRDMAIIARAAFQNPTVAKVASTLSYEFPATKKASARTITMGHKMLYPNDSRYYDGIVAGKTGYTSKAGNTLATCAERDGLRLIAIIMKSSQTHYEDTKALLDYGFALAEAGELSTSGSSGGSSQTTAGWHQDTTGWYYIKSDGTRAANEWQTINGKEYWFDSNQYMATGWRQFVGGIWYYFQPDGSLAKNAWVQNSAGQWFYVGSTGEMLRNTTTPDGNYVNADGVWVQQ